MKPVYHVTDIHHATHVQIGRRVERIAGKWGVGANGKLAKPSAGGFGVVTESGERVSMFEAQRYFAEQTTFRKGDKVRAAFKGQTAVGTVVLASENGKSLMLHFPDRMMGGYVELLPVLWDGTTFVDLIESQPIELEIESEDR